MNLAGRKIGESYDPLVIAEIGINHGGDLKVAMEMVDASPKRCGSYQASNSYCWGWNDGEAKSVIPENADVSIQDYEDCSLSEEEELN